MFEVFPGYNSTPMTELAMQLPMLNHAVAYAPDWNNDGVPDLWHHNHYAFSGAESRWSDPGTEIRGPEREVGGCMVDWDAVLRDDKKGTWYPANNGDGFIEWTDGRLAKCFDSHSTAFLDIDGDGFKDLFLVTGGGRGVGHSYDFDNILFWGEPTNSSLGYKLVGGRGAARLALIEGRKRNHNERGRHQYWFDVNDDGLLDIVFLNEERSDNVLRPGQLYLNNGDRTFAKVKPDEKGFAEFATMALLTDLDGDGYARELLVPSDCVERNEDEDYAWNFVCERSPRGSIGVYRRGSDRYLTRESIYIPSQRHEKAVKAIATGDFDLDGFVDVAVLWGRKLNFHYSSSRKSRCKDVINPSKLRTCLHTLGEADYRLALDECGKGGANGLRFADFNLDGRLDMLAVCKSPGRQLIYELMEDGSWRVMQGDNGEIMNFGALQNPELMMGGKDFCEGVPVTKRQDRCDRQFTKEECKNVRYTNQLVVCSMRALEPTKPNATALGATIADVDNDGYMDIILGYRSGSTVMFRNKFGDTFGEESRNRFFALTLDAKASAATAIGAIVKLKADRMGPHANETTFQTRVISSLSHETDSNGGVDNRLVFGLGKQGRILKLIIHWPNCCQPTYISAKQKELWTRMNSMSFPFKVPAPKKCDKSCLPRAT